jgi:chromosome segregation ATPase
MNGKILVCAAAALLAADCAGTTDPRQGGLFSYSPRAYEERQQEREARLAAIESEQARERQSNEALRAEQTARQSQVDRQRNELAGLKRESQQLDSRLSSIQTGNAEQLAKLDELRKRHGDINRQMSALDAGIDAGEQGAKLAALKAELEQLEREADILSDL